MSKAIVSIIGAIIVIFLLSAVLLSLNNFITKEQIDPYSVTTGGGVTTYDATLSQTLFDSDRSLATVTSNITPLDAAIASSYNSITKVLTVTGLAASQTRTLYVTYRIAALGWYTGAETLVKWVIIFIIMALFGIIAAAVNHAWKEHQY